MIGIMTQTLHLNIIIMIIELGGWMTQRDEGHDYRDSKNKAQAHERRKVTIIWGTEAVKGIDPIEIGLNKKTYRFETEEQLKYFMMGVDEGNGWLEYEVEES